MTINIASRFEEDPDFTVFTPVAETPEALAAQNRAVMNGAAVVRLAEVAETVETIPEEQEVVFDPEIEGMKPGRVDGWKLVCEGFGASQEIGLKKQETRLKKRFALGNGILTYSDITDDESALCYIKGLYEPMDVRPPREWGSKEEDIAKQSKVPSLLALPDYQVLKIKIGDRYAEFDKPTAVRTLDIESGTLAIDGTIHEIDNSGDKTDREMAVKVTEFLDKNDPHLAFRHVSFEPNYGGKVSLVSGINGRRPKDSKDYYRQTNVEQLGEDPSTGIKYTAESLSGHEIAIGQRVVVLRDGVEIDVQPTIRAGEKYIKQEFEIDVEEGHSYEMVICASVHSDVDQAIIEGHQSDPVEACTHELSAMPNYQAHLTAHKEAWGRLWDEADIDVDGDPEVQLALRFNLWHLLADVREGYVWGDIAAKIANDEGSGYGGRGFWDADIFVLSSLPPALRRTLLDYRFEQLAAARKKAERYGYDGAWFPWEGHFPYPPEDGEGGPESILNNVNKLVKVKTITEAVHISADVAFAAMQYFEETGDEESMRERYAEIILESARFLVSRASENERGQFVYKNVTGPDEYHEDVTNNAYTLIMSAYTLSAAEWLLGNESLSEKAKVRIGLTDAEIERWNHVRKNLLIPFNPDTLVFSAFEGWDDLKHTGHVNLQEDRYRGVKSMDEKLNEENPSAEGNLIGKTDVIKQHDAVLAITLLGPKLLDILPDYTVAELSQKYESNQAIMGAIHRANHDEYVPQTSDGSSLSPSTGVLARLNAGENPDDVYDDFRKVVLMDLSRKNTHKTEDGLHTANAGMSVHLATEGFMGITFDRDSDGQSSLSINPRMPSRWKSASVVKSYHGSLVRITVDQAAEEISVERVRIPGRPVENDLSIVINGHAKTLYAADDDITLRTDLRDIKWIRNQSQVESVA